MVAQGEAAIEIQNLTKRYGDLTVVDSLDLRIEKGEVFGLLGPNGAGKTTTILMILGLTEPSGGAMKVLGLDPLRNPLEVKRKVGYLPEDLGFYEDLTGRENLTYTARLNGLSLQDVSGRIDVLLDRVGLGDAADKKVQFYSHGMKQRLGLADVLVKKPEIIILDEPTNGIDPKGAEEVLKMIVDLKRDEGMTVLVSSHLLNQIQSICDRVGIFVNGHMVAKGPIQTLGELMVQGQPLTVEVEITPMNQDICENLRLINGVIALEEQQNRLSIEASRDIRADISQVVFRHGAAIVYMRLKGVELSDIYMRYFQEVIPHEGEVS